MNYAKVLGKIAGAAVAGIQVYMQYKDDIKAEVVDSAKGRKNDKSDKNNN